MSGAANPLNALLFSNISITSPFSNSSEIPVLVLEMCFRVKTLQHHKPVMMHLTSTLAIPCSGWLVLASPSYGGRVACDLACPPSCRAVASAKVEALREGGFTSLHSRLLSLPAAAGERFRISVSQWSERDERHGR